MLADLGSYPAWWPQVRSIRQVAEDAAELVCRSVLPYDLVFRASHERKDKAAGELRARLTGDLDGYAGWTIEPRGHGTRLVFTQGVEVTKPLLRRLGLIARPALLVNHELMMRQGRRGLRTLLAPPS
ncbi:hypothetical protein EV193_102291 [Herbihabitans rhizosphaerae]|uniref:Polyketide cyclase/dehydrase/lipid transport protein n=1 Tax=Herbihabitans rhizosphaerae TaxID=1872711 RepID=A0A4Q7L500_9PSEU|nr:hypothetical protein EV193_102291 [Herbihabitans rhizosphaerae]